MSEENHAGCSRNLPAAVASNRDVARRLQGGKSSPKFKSSSHVIKQLNKVLCCKVCCGLCLTAFFEAKAQLTAQEIVPDWRGAQSNYTGEAKSSPASTESQKGDSLQATESDLNPSLRTTVVAARSHKETATSGDQRVAQTPHKTLNGNNSSQVIGSSEII